MKSLRLWIVFFLMPSLLTLAACNGSGTGARSNSSADPNSDPGNAAIVYNANGFREHYVYKVAKSADAEKLKALEIELEVDQTSSSEGFLINFVALSPTQTPSKKDRVTLIGQTAIYKALKKGERTNVYLDAPPQAAWVQTKGGLELNISFEVLAGHAERKKPEIGLRIVQVEGKY